MSTPLPSERSELDVAEILRRQRAVAHEQVDLQFDRLCLELGIQPPEAPETIGISFEPGVVVEYVPEDSEDIEPGIYQIRAGRQIEVVPSPTAGKVFFEITDDRGQIATRSLDETLFHQLFRTNRLLATGQPKVRYGLHPLNSKIAVRYNVNGSVTLGRYGNEGEFLADSE